VLGSQGSPLPQPPDVDDPLHAGRLRGLYEVAGCGPVELGEADPRPGARHGVDEVVGQANPLDRLVEPLSRDEVSLDGLHPHLPKGSGPGWIPHQGTYRVPFRSQTRGQGPPHEARGPSYENGCALFDHGSDARPSDDYPLIPFPPLNLPASPGKMGVPGVLGFPTTIGHSSSKRRTPPLRADPTRTGGVQRHKRVPIWDFRWVLLFGRRYHQW
jgi:hypothetical protein